jgi:hypothetical protein
MAPERGHGRPADVRSDLYSLGCTLYFLLTGQVPFPGGGWPEKLLRHQLDLPVPVRALRPDVPPAVAAVVERLMAPDPARRYPTPAALLAALEGPGAVAAPAATHRRRWRPSPWLALAAVLSGTLIGWVTRAALTRPAPLPHKAPARAASATRALTFTVEGRPGRFDSLAGAVAAARSGDTVVLHGPGRARTPPLAWQGKALTLRAAPGGRPVLELAAPEHPWQALLCGDSDLTLEGLELRHALPREAGPLVCVEGAALRLTDCGLYSAAGGPLVVSRGGRELALRGCRLDAGAVGVSAEVGGPCRVTLEGNTVTVREPSGVALSLWSAELSAPAAADVRLARNTCSAGRVAAFRGLTGPLALTAQGNHFCFREGVLSFDHYEAGGWRRTTTWRGRDNRFDGTGAWLRVEGRPAPVRDLAGWQRLWDEPPPGSAVEGGGRVQAAPAPDRAGASPLYSPATAANMVPGGANGVSP